MALQSVHIRKYYFANVNIFLTTNLILPFYISSSVRAVFYKYCWNSIKWQNHCSEYVSYKLFALNSSNGRKYMHVSSFIVVKWLIGNHCLLCALWQHSTWRIQRGLSFCQITGQTPAPALWWKYREGMPQQTPPGRSWGPSRLPLPLPLILWRSPTIHRPTSPTLTASHWTTTTWTDSKYRRFNILHLRKR